MVFPNVSMKSYQMIFFESSEPNTELDEETYFDEPSPTVHINISTNKSSSINQ